MTNQYEPDPPNAAKYATGKVARAQAHSSGTGPRRIRESSAHSGRHPDRPRSLPVHRAAIVLAGNLHVASVGPPDSPVLNYVLLRQRPLGRGPSVPRTLPDGVSRGMQGWSRSLCAAAARTIAD